MRIERKTKDIVQEYLLLEDLRKREQKNNFQAYKKLTIRSSELYQDIINQGRLKELKREIELQKIYK